MAKIESFVAAADRIKNLLAVKIMEIFGMTQH
jgi:hypothetical protein